MLQPNVNRSKSNVFLCFWTKICFLVEDTPTKLHLCFTLLSLQTTQNKHNAPYRRVSLSNLCRMMSGLRQETWSGEEQEENLQLMEELSSLRHICRALQSREERVRQHAHTQTHAQTHTHTSILLTLLISSPPQPPSFSFTFSHGGLRSALNPSVLLLCRTVRVAVSVLVM